MVNNTFTKAINDFLEDRIDLVKFNEISREFSKKYEEINSIEKSLQSLLPKTVDSPNGPVDIQLLLMKLSDKNGDLYTIASEYAYKKGFSEGIRFIVYNLIMN